MDFEDLLAVQDNLDERLLDGSIERLQYEREWSELLRAAGWTEDEYAAQIDLRWDYIDRLRAIPTRTHTLN